MTLEKPPPELNLLIDQHPEHLVLVGPSFQGVVYRSREGPYCYRVWLQAEMRLAWRQEVQGWVGRHLHPSLAPIIRAWQPHDLPNSYVVQYNVRQLDRPLTEALVDPEPGRRIDYAIRALRALPDWWRELWCPLLPMPADIVFTSQNQVLLLPFPQGPLPEVEEIFAAPERALYLAPELVRGKVADGWENIDRYALGVALWQCFTSFSPPTDIGEQLLQAARGEALASPRSVSNLPLWLERLAATQQAIAQVRRLLAPDPEVRGLVNLERLSDRLRDWRGQMNPLTAARELRDANRVLEAFDLLQQTLLTQESYDILLLAGQIAGKYLHRPLEALDLLERAIIKEPARSEAYEEQFKVIAAGRHHAQLRQLIESDNPRKEQIDTLFRRDFDKISPDLRQSHELAKANYLIWRQKYDEAARFIYDLIVRGNTFQWWKFDLNLAYAEALIGLGEYEKAKEQLQIIREGLEHTRNNATLDNAEYQQHSHTLADLTSRLATKLN